MRRTHDVGMTTTIRLRGPPTSSSCPTTWGTGRPTPRRRLSAAQPDRGRRPHRPAARRCRPGARRRRAPPCVRRERPDAVVVIVGFETEEGQGRAGQLGHAQTPCGPPGPRLGPARPRRAVVEPRLRRRCCPADGEPPRPTTRSRPSRTTSSAGAGRLVPGRPRRSVAVPTRPGAGHPAARPSSTPCAPPSARGRPWPVATPDLPPVARILDPTPAGPDAVAGRHRPGRGVGRGRSSPCSTCRRATSSSRGCVRGPSISTCSRRRCAGWPRPSCFPRRAGRMGRSEMGATSARRRAGTRCRGAAR